MNREPAGAWALIAAATLYVGLMAVHPTHGGVAPMIGAVTLNNAVHGASFVSQSLMLFGLWRLTRQMGERPLAQLALCFGLFAGMLTIMAATMSGFVIPAIIAVAHGGAGAHAPGPMDPHSLQPLASYTVWLNRAFATIHVGMFATAMALWAIAWPARALLEWIARALGLVLGLGVLALAFSGVLTLEARQGALLVTVAQMLWVLVAASVMLTAKGKA